MIAQKKIQDLDAKFEQKIQSATLEVSDSEFTPEKAKGRRAMASASDLDFCKIYFPKIFDSPFNDLHITVSRWNRGNYSLSGSRRFGKSAFVYIGKVVKHIAEGRGGIVNISLADEDNAKERTSSLNRIIQGNKLLCYDYEIEVIQDAKGYYIYQSLGGQTTMIATSVRQGLRSLMDDNFKRFKLAVADDLYSRQNVKSEVHRDKVFNFIVSELWGQMEPNGLSITIGNSITEDAPIVRIRKEHTEENGRHYGLPAMNTDESKSNWPERFSVDDLLQFKADLPYDVWMGDYMDSPVEVGEIMDPDWIRFVNINLIDIIVSIAVADPAHGESPAACDKGLVTLGVDAKHNVYVQDIYLRKEDYMLFFDYAGSLTQRFGIRVLLFENDFNQWSHARPYYQDWLSQNKRPLPIMAFQSSELETLYRGTDKGSRLMNLVHPHQTGQIAYSSDIEDSPDFRRYKNENYLRFGTSKRVKLDGLDAFASGYIQIWSYINTGSFKPLKKRAFQKDKLSGWFR
mgnify:CR=1 FL=1